MLFLPELCAIGLFLAFLVFLSAVEGAITQSSSLALRMMLEREETKVPSLLSQVLEDKMQVLVPLHLGTQVCLIAIAIFTTHLSLQRWPNLGVAVAFVIIFLISVIFRQLLPRLLTQNNPEAKLSTLLVAFAPIYPMLRSLALPLSSTLGIFKRLHEDAEKAESSEDEEVKDEEIQAYLEIGEDEGILEKEDSKLIQSVVEFGDTLVREIMTPRNRVVACEENSTLGELRDIMVNHRHSRIPIYRGDIDHIIGVAYIRQLVAHYQPGRESETIASLTHPVLFVPETKPVASLMRELQERGDNIAIVIDEFGLVAGLVTMEDLVEEIVGEIRDEDQAKVNEVVEEGPRSFIVRGSTDLYALQEILGRKFEADASTVAGMIVASLGRLPNVGEEFDLSGLHIQILEADRKRIHRMRIQLPVAVQEKT